MKHFITWVIITLCLTITVSVQAQPWQDLTPQQRLHRMHTWCGYLGGFAEIAAQDRDRGVPLSKMLTLLQKSDTGSKRDRFLRQLIIAIYAERDMTPQEWRYQAELSCSQTVEKHSWEEEPGRLPKVTGHEEDITPHL